MGDQHRIKMRSKARVEKTVIGLFVALLDLGFMVEMHN
jgi:hypothetical protein